MPEIHLCGYVWVVQMRWFWRPRETVIGGRNRLIWVPGKLPRPLLDPHGWSGAAVFIQMGGRPAEENGLRYLTFMVEFSLEH